MKVFTPEISWHQKKPVYSLDFCKNTWKLASSGADLVIRIWQVKVDEKEHVGLDFLADLDRHEKAVNVVRFSPGGELLASAGDDCIIILWKLASTDEENKVVKKIDEEDVGNKESWVVHKMLRRGHLSDIYDLAWSPDATQLISGSVDNTAIVWNLKEGNFSKIITDHKHFVQGVCWDPRGDYYVTHSSDRTCRIYDSATGKCLSSLTKAGFQVNTEEGVKKKACRLFMDETMQSFFRRCKFSPDGSILVLPGGVYEASGKSEKATYVISRRQLSKPAFHLPSSKKATVAVCFCPLIFELCKRDGEIDVESENILSLPYRLVFAVISLDTIVLYDTQHIYPIGYVKNVHYSTLTDATWSTDGRLLVVSSGDGYCSIVEFSQNELGTPITFDPIQYQVEREKIEEARKQALKAAKQNKNTVSQESNADFLSKTKEIAKTKEKIGGNKSTSPNQGTLEMFIGSARKRKRPKSVSPHSESETETKASLKTANASQPANKGFPSPVSSNTNGKVSKPPRRISLQSVSASAASRQVVVVDDEELDKQKTTQDKTSAVNSVVNKQNCGGVVSSKPAKRVQLIAVGSESIQPKSPSADNRATVENAKYCQDSLKQTDRVTCQVKRKVTDTDLTPKPCKRVQLVPAHTEALQTKSADDSRPSLLQSVPGKNASCSNGTNSSQIERNDTTQASTVSGSLSNDKLASKSFGNGATDSLPQTIKTELLTEVALEISNKAVTKQAFEEQSVDFRTASTEGGKDEARKALYIDLTTDENSTETPEPVRLENKSITKVPKRVALCTLQSYSEKNTKSSSSLQSSKTSSDQTG